MITWLIWILIIGGILAIIVLLALIIRELSSGREAEVGEVVRSRPEEPEEHRPEPPPRKESDRERLTRMEKELSEREERVKSEKIRELEERERLIKDRGEEDSMPPEPVPEGEEVDLESERARLQDLIKKTEESYAAGELEEKNFKRIISDYQQQIVDLDVKLKRRRDL